MNNSRRRNDYENQIHRVCYSCRLSDGGISILDDSLGIDWKIATEKANLSEKDTKHAMLKDFESPFSIDVDLYANR